MLKRKPDGTADLFEFGELNAEEVIVPQVRIMINSFGRFSGQAA